MKVIDDQNLVEYLKSDVKLSLSQYNYATIEIPFLKFIKEHEMIFVSM